jgi:hypothetical protein
MWEEDIKKPAELETISYTASYIKPRLGTLLIDRSHGSERTPWLAD